MASQSRRFSWRGYLLLSDLPPSARLVAFALSMHMDEAGGSCYPGHKRLAKETGLGRATVIRSLTLLESEGWVEVSRGTGRGYTNNYIAAVPMGFIPSEEKGLTVTPFRKKGSHGGHKGSHHETGGVSPWNISTTSSTSLTRTIEYRNPPPTPEEEARLREALDAQRPTKKAADA